MKRLISRLLISASSILVIGCSTSMNSYEPSVYENAFFTDYVPTHISGNKFDEFTDNPFVNVVDNPTSTFSVDADGASYGIMRKSIDKGYTIEKSSVRIEEFGSLPMEHIPSAPALGHQGNGFESRRKASRKLRLLGGCLWFHVFRRQVATTEVGLE